MALAADMFAVSGFVVCDGASEVACPSHVQDVLHRISSHGLLVSACHYSVGQLSCEHGGCCIWMLSYPLKVLGVCLVCSALQENRHSLKHRMIESL